MEDDGTRLGKLNYRIQDSLGRIAIMSDCAHDLGAKRMFNNEWKFCGQISDFTNFSFHAVKNFTTAEGGAATWQTFDGVNDKDIYDMYQLLSLHGQNKDAFAKTQGGSWEYDIVGPWYKYNMTDIMAAIGLAQLNRYPSLLRKRRQIIERYDSMCDRLGLRYLVHKTDYMVSSAHLYLVRIPGVNEEKRNALIRDLAGRGIATNVHYKPLPMMTAYRNLGWNIKDFPNAYDYYKNEISLPLHTLLGDSDVDYICEEFEKAINHLRLI